MDSTSLENASRDLASSTSTYGHLSLGLRFLQLKFKSLEDFLISTSIVAESTDLPPKNVHSEVYVPKIRILLILYRLFFLKQLRRTAASYLEFGV